MSFVKSKRTLQLIGNGRTMNKERKCLTFKTNEKSVCKRASPADGFHLIEASAHAKEISMEK